MSYRPSYSRGNWLTICDVCGRKYEASSLKLRWDGVMVCSGDWEPRQPQDFVRGVADIQAPPWTRPEQQDSFIPIHYTGPATTALVVSSCQLQAEYIKYVPHVLDGSALNTAAIG